jgi:hypothetical protein
VPRLAAAGDALAPAALLELVVTLAVGGAYAAPATIVAPSSFEIRILDLLRLMSWISLTIVGARR